MFEQWDELIDLITRSSINNGFLDIFMHTAIDDKVSLCEQSRFIRGCLERWLDSADFDKSLKNIDKSKELRLKGNEEFKKDHLELCCKLYTKAAQFAPCKSIELALALSNRSAMYMRLNKFQDCLKDIDVSLDVLDNFDMNDEVNKGQLIVKLLKRKIECFIALNQFKKGQACLENLLELSNNVYKIPLQDQFIKKCKILSDSDKHDPIKTDIVKNSVEFIQPTMLTEDLIKKTLEKNNIILPFKSPKLKLCYTEAKGKHFVASRKIDYGELLMFENPFAFVLLPDYYDLFCYNCCAVLKHYSVPCNNCCTILFCDEKCRQESWDLYHRWECKQGTSVFKCIGIAHLALRLTLETLRPGSKSDDIHKLLTHVEDLKFLDIFQYSLTATLLLIYLQTKTDFFEKHPKLVLKSVGNELFYNMARLVCNGNAISTHVMSDYDSESLISIIDESQPRIGTAIFPTSSLLNHSCDPNIFSSNILKYVVIKASRDIKEGEEVTNCYGPNYRRMRLIERQSTLITQYHFECECCICTTDLYKEYMLFQIIEGLVCVSCHNEIRESLSDLESYDSVYCSFCSKRFSTTEYKRRLIIADKTYNKGINYFKKKHFIKATNKILASLKLYSLILSKKNSNITKCKNSLAKCFAASGDFKSCYDYLDRSFHAIEEHYGQNSLEVAYELDKISDIMVNNMNVEDNWHLIKKALVYVRRSMDIFNANLSAWDLPYSESGIANMKNKESVLLQLLEDFE